MNDIAGPKFADGVQGGIPSGPNDSTHETLEQEVGRSFWVHISLGLVLRQAVAEECEYAAGASLRGQLVRRQAGVVRVRHGRGHGRDERGGIGNVVGCQAKVGGRLFRRGRCCCC